MRLSAEASQTWAVAGVDGPRVGGGWHAEYAVARIDTPARVVDADGARGVARGGLRIIGQCRPDADRHRVDGRAESICTPGSASGTSEDRHGDRT